jgi:hypothetical protein
VVCFFVYIWEGECRSVLKLVAGLLFHDLDERDLKVQLAAGILDQAFGIGVV